MTPENTTPTAYSGQLRADLPDYDTFSRWLTNRHRLAPATALTYVRRAHLAVDWFTVNFPGVPLLEITHAEIEEYLAELADHGHAPSTRRTSLDALRRLYDYLSRHLPAPINPAEHVRPPSPPRPAPMPLYSSAELDHLISYARQQCDRHPAGSASWIRAQVNCTTALLARYTAGRTNELVTLKTADIDLQDNRLTFNGFKSRTIPIASPLTTALSFYLTEIRPLCPPSRYLLSNPNGRAGSSAYGTLTGHSVRTIIAGLGQGTGLDGPHHIERLRRSVANDMLGCGVSLPIIAQIRGHSHLKTTAHLLAVTYNDVTQYLTEAYPDDGPHHEEPNAA